jgi:hypothetical protein
MEVKRIKRTVILKGATAVELERVLQVWVNQGLDVSNYVLEFNPVWNARYPWRLVSHTEVPTDEEITKRRSYAGWGQGRGFTEHLYEW